MSAHFNGLSPAEAERLACLSEECGEVVQAIGKILRHGYESYYPGSSISNRSSLCHEIGDVLATVDLLVNSADTDTEEIEARRLHKHKSRKKYFHHQPDNIRVKP